MRASLPLLCLASLALAAVSVACFDWDGYISRCQDAGNCRADSGGNAGDGGDGGGGGQDASSGGDGGDGGGGSPGGPGSSCNQPGECRTGSCVTSLCICVVDGPCQSNSDCCLGQTCAGPSCMTSAALACSGATASCVSSGDCCSNSCNGGYMCDCSPAGARCNTSSDCCSASQTCTRGFCCIPTGGSCSAHDECCSRACGGTGYCL